ncbi:hypothetical protein [Clostridium sp.]|uniref:hypothetical protein n=1 Tax=Clostridium sp. TaxID=1506 RepID=UPI0032169EED
MEIIILVVIIVVILILTIITVICIYKNKDLSIKLNLFKETVYFQLDIENKTKK